MVYLSTTRCVRSAVCTKNNQRTPSHSESADTAGALAGLTSCIHSTAVQGGLVSGGPAPARTYHQSHVPQNPTRFLGALCAALLVYSASVVVAHESGAPFSGAIIEPLRVHHAHIEDEQRLNSSFLSRFRAEDGTRAAFTNNLEFAVAWTDDYSLGSEILIPFSNAGFDRSDYSIGDIEIWPLKYAFVNSPETILTGVLGFTLPSGDESKGLGEGKAAIGPLFFADHAHGNWFIGMNAELETALSGETTTEAELAAVLSYSFIPETGGGVAPSRPDQFLVPSLSFETIFEAALAGEEKGERIVSVLPGIHLWHPASGWGVRFGVDIPIGSEKLADYAVLFHFGNHFDWNQF